MSPEVVLTLGKMILRVHHSRRCDMNAFSGTNQTKRFRVVGSLIEASLSILINTVQKPEEELRNVSTHS